MAKASNIEGEACEGGHCCCSNYCFFEIYAVVNKANVACGVFCFWTLDCQKIYDFCLNLSLHAVLDML